MDKLKAALSSVLIVILSGIFLFVTSSALNACFAPKDVYESGDVIQFLEELLQ